jgi:hypothetical protein
LKPERLTAEPSTFLVGAVHDKVASRSMTLVIASAFPAGPEHVSE